MDKTSWTYTTVLIIFIPIMILEKIYFCSRLSRTENGNSPSGIPPAVRIKRGLCELRGFRRSVPELKFTSSRIYSNKMDKLRNNTRTRYAEFLIWGLSFSVSLCFSLFRSANLVRGIRELFCISKQDGGGANKFANISSIF